MQPCILRNTPHGLLVSMYMYELGGGIREWGKCKGCHIDMVKYMCVGWEGVEISRWWLRWRLSRGQMASGGEHLPYTTVYLYNAPHLPAYL